MTLPRTAMPRTLPTKEPKYRQRKCALFSCRALFAPRSMSHKCCSPICAQAYVEAEKARKDRSERQAGLAKLKRRADYLKETQAAFNSWVRERDANQPCICCGRVGTSVQGLHTHGWDSGHYRSVGSAPHLRFHEDNVHRQLVYCNRNRSGNAVDYRIGLIARIGLERVEALEADNVPRKHTVEELLALKAHYRAKLKELTKLAHKRITVPSKGKKMTPFQKVKHLVLISAYGMSNEEIPVITAENIEEVYQDARYREELEDCIQDAKGEVRGGEVETYVPCEWSRHYEAKSVAAKAPDGSWIGWTYWYGGGKHSEPESIEWMEYAYDLTFVEEEKMVIIRTFTKVDVNNNPEKD